MTTKLTKRPTDRPMYHIEVLETLHEAFKRIDLLEASGHIGEALAISKRTTEQGQTDRQLNLLRHNGMLKEGEGVLEKPSKTGLFKSGFDRRDILRVRNDHLAQLEAMRGSAYHDAHHIDLRKKTIVREGVAALRDLQTTGPDNRIRNLEVKAAERSRALRSLRKSLHYINSLRRQGGISNAEISSRRIAAHKDAVLALKKIDGSAADQPGAKKKAKHPQSFPNIAARDITFLAVHGGRPRYLVHRYCPKRSENENHRSLLIMPTKRKVAKRGPVNDKWIDVKMIDSGPALCLACGQKLGKKGYSWLKGLWDGDQVESPVSVFAKEDSRSEAFIAAGIKGGGNYRTFVLQSHYASGQLRGSVGSSVSSSSRKPKTDFRELLDSIIREPGRIGASSKRGWPDDLPTSEPSIGKAVARSRKARRRGKIIRNKGKRIRKVPTGFV